MKRFTFNLVTVALGVAIVLLVHDHVTVSCTNVLVNFCTVVYH